MLYYSASPTILTSFELDPDRVRCYLVLCISPLTVANSANPFLNPREKTLE
jgi:hypothetical protein